jgi:hypothetical protein
MTPGPHRLGDTYEDWEMSPLLVDRERVSCAPYMIATRSAAAQYVPAISHQRVPVSRPGVRKPKVLVAPWSKVVMRTLPLFSNLRTCSNGYSASAIASFLTGTRCRLVPKKMTKMIATITVTIASNQRFSPKAIPPLKKTKKFCPVWNTIPMTMPYCV